MTNAQHDAYICQQWLTDELNDKIFNRNIPSSTLEPYFEFKDTNNVDVSYEKSYSKEGYGLILKVNAVFVNEEDLAMFRLRFGGDYPKVKFSEQPTRFIA